MTFLQISYEHLMNVKQFHWKSKKLLWFFRFTNFLKNVLQTSCEILTDFLWTSNRSPENRKNYYGFFRITIFLKMFYKVLMRFLPTSYELLTNYLWTSYELLMNFLWTPCGLHMNFLSTSNKSIENCGIIKFIRFTN